MISDIIIKTRNITPSLLLLLAGLSKAGNLNMERLFECLFLIIPSDRNKLPPLRKWEPPHPPTPPPPPPPLPSPEKYKKKNKRKKKECKSRHLDIEDLEDGDEEEEEESAAVGTIQRWFPCFNTLEPVIFRRKKKNEIVPIIGTPLRRSSIYDRIGNRSLTLTLFDIVSFVLCVSATCCFR